MEIFEYHKRISITRFHIFHIFRLLRCRTFIYLRRLYQLFSSTVNDRIECLNFAEEVCNATREDFLINNGFHLFLVRLEILSFFLHYSGQGDRTFVIQHEWVVERVIDPRST